jgi:hypothetical protein
MEYLITYGWALLLIAIITSLLYLYIIVPRVIVPASCSFVSGVYCNDLILGSNTTTHASVLGLFITNTQPYPIANPVLYVGINGANVTPVACKPSYVLAGGSILCTIPLNQKTSFGQFVIGNLYINASYCGLANATTPASCSSAPTQIYIGKFNAHVAPLVSTTSSLTLTAQNTTNPGNPANNARDPLHAIVKLLGYPLAGATVNFTVTYPNNGAIATPPYSLLSQYTTTGATGGAVDYVWGTTVGNVVVKAQYANLNTSIGITFTPVTKITFKAPSASALMASSALPVVTIDGTNYDYAQLQNKTFVWGCGSTHTYSFLSIPYNASGSRLIFQDSVINGITSTTNSGSMTVDCSLTNQTESAYYASQYEFTSSVHPSTGGTVSPVNSWYGEYSQVAIGETPNANYVFKNWTGTGAGSYTGQSPSSTVLMEGPVNETLNYYAPIGITLESSSMTGTSGAVVTVDGTQYTFAQLPHIITTSYGAVITYAYTTNVSAGSSTQYGIPVVSGCATSVSGSFVAQQNCTLMGQYTLQYALSMSASPTAGGTITPGPGTYWENAGSTNTISESPNSGQNYVFNTWAGTGTGSYSSTAASSSITMDGPITEVAEYHSPLIITFQPSIAGASGNMLKVNNVQYTASQMPVTVGVKYGETVTYAYNTTPISGGTGTQYIINGASGCGASGTGSSFTATANCTVTATYTTQYQLTMASAPANGGTTSPAAGTYWENSGTAVPISQTPNINYVFHQWTGSGTGSYTGATSSSSVTMSSPITETSYYYTPIIVKFYATGIIGTPSGTVLTANNTNYAYGSPVATIGVPYGSSVSYNYASPVSGGTNVRSIYSSISGCGASAQSGSFTATANCSVTATYTGQYQLTTAVSPSGAGTVSASPAGPWYNSGTIVSLTATPNTNYVFKNWTGTTAGTTNPLSVTMSGPVTETANFYPPVNITFTATGLVGTPSGTVVTVAGTNYDSAQLPVHVITYYGSGTTYAYVSPVSGGTNVQSVYSSISGCGASAQSGTVTAPASSCTVTATYTGQYELTMAVSPSGSGTTTPSIGSYWYAAGTSIGISESPNTNYVFKNWTSSVPGSGYSGTSASDTITMPSSGLTETANFYPPVTVTFTSSTMSGTDSNTVVTVGTTNYPYASPLASLTVPYGSSVTYSYALNVGAGTGTQYLYSSLSGCGQTAQSASFTATASCTVTAAYTTQYQLTMAASPSNGGTTSPAAGTYWENSGSSVAISETPSKNYVLDTWIGTGTVSYSSTAASSSITMNSPISETASYYSPVQITYDISSMSGTSGTVLTTNNTSYSYSQFPVTIGVPYGSSVQYAFASPVSGYTNTQYAFSSLSGCGQSAQSATFTATAGCTVTAAYTTQYELTTAMSPSGAGTVSASPAGPWYNSGAIVSLTATPNTNYVFDDWSGTATGTSNPLSVTINNNVTTETANFYPPLTITFTSSAMSGTDSNTVVTVGTTNYPYASPLASLTVPYGSSVTYLYASTVSAGTDTQYAFSPLSGCGQTAQSATFTATASCTVTAAYTLQYELTTAVSPSGAGTVSASPNTGPWYNSGAIVSLTAIPDNSNTEHVFSSWTGTTASTSNPLSVTMSGPVTETANFATPTCVVGGGTECGYSNCASGFSCVGNGKYFVTVSGGGCIPSGGGKQTGTCKTTTSTVSTTTVSTTSVAATTTIIYALMVGNGTNDNVYYGELSSSTSWQTSASYPISYTSPICLTDNAYVYCIGGINSAGSYTDAVYSGLLTGSGVTSWASQPSVPLGSYASGFGDNKCVLYSGYIYCYTYGSDVVYWATASSGTVGSWSATTMYVPTSDLPSGGGCVTYNGNLICIGSVSDSGSLNVASLSSIRAGSTVDWTYTGLLDNNNVNNNLYLCNGDLEPVISSSGVVFALGNGYTGPNTCSDLSSENATVFYTANPSNGNSYWYETGSSYPWVLGGQGCSYAPGTSNLYCAGGADVATPTSTSQYTSNYIYSADTSTNNINSWPLIGTLPISAYDSPFIIYTTTSVSTTVTTISVTGSCVVGGGTECGAVNCASGYTCVGNGKYFITVSGGGCTEKPSGSEFGTCESTSVSVTTVSVSTATISTKPTTSVKSTASIYGDTQILLADGIYENASNITPGTVILSYNLNTHKLQPSVVSDVQVLTSSNKYIFNKLLQTDSGELLFINGRWARAYTAKVGDVLFDPLTNTNVTITSLQVLKKGGKVYDFLGTPVNNYIADGYLIDKDKTIGDSVFGNATISMANGAGIPVSSLRQGDVVMSYDIQTGRLVPSTVTSMDIVYGNQTYTINDKLVVDGQEDLLVNGQNMLARNVRIGDSLFDPLTRQNVTVTSIVIANTTKKTFYDINTEPIDDYVVDGYLVT